MFLDFYGLREQPFGVTPDPTYHYLSRTHHEALAALLEGIKADRGFMALIAEPGMGKTTILYRLMAEVQDSAPPRALECPRDGLLYRASAQGGWLFRRPAIRTGCSVANCGAKPRHPARDQQHLLPCLVTGRGQRMPSDQRRNRAGGSCEHSRRFHHAAIADPG